MLGRGGEQRQRPRRHEETVARGRCGGPAERARAARRPGPRGPPRGGCRSGPSSSSRAPCAQAASVSIPRAETGVKPPARAAAARSSAVFPIPLAPSRTSAPARPSAASASTWSIRASSGARPTSRPSGSAGSRVFPDATASVPGRRCPGGNPSGGRHEAVIGPDPSDHRPADEVVRVVPGRTPGPAVGGVGPVSGPCPHERAVELMPTFAGVDHLSLTVTDLDVSERFYTEVLDFTGARGLRVRAHPAAPPDRVRPQPGPARRRGRRAVQRAAHRRRPHRPHRRQPRRARWPGRSGSGRRASCSRRSATWRSGTT